jgi:poly(3-hydroxybutyrate) depolymerase
MKNLNRLFLGLIMVAVVVGCKDKAAEKRIAELEGRLAQLEGNKPATAATPATPAATPAEVKPEGPLPVIEFADTDHDFGTISEGKKVSYTYKFKNTGEAPLIIQNAQPSCGCTVPDWTKEPIPVGGTGFVKAEFDSNGKPNIQNKTITVTANTWPKTTTLRFKAMVTPKADAGANGPVK